MNIKTATTAELQKRLKYLQAIKRKSPEAGHIKGQLRLRGEL